MRPLPEGIEARRATSADIGPMIDTIDEGIAGYLSSAPAGWRPPVTPEPVRRAIAERYDGDDAWALIAAAGRDTAGLVSVSSVVRASRDAAPPGTGYLWQMFVRPPWQGSGLAGALIDRAFEEALARGWTRLILWTPRDQAQARRFYEREGFTARGREQFSEEIGLPLVQYERPLNPQSGV
jgi:GNAT superfamily N-acetyltransferase